MTTRRSKQLHVAQALADALLAGLPLPASAQRRCTDALGDHPPWLNGVLHAVRVQYASRWHPQLRQQLADFIALQPTYQDAWLADPAQQPQIRRYLINAPRMAEARLPLDRGALVLPELPATGDLAYWLGLTIGELQWFADLQGRSPREKDARLQHYVLRAVPKRHGQWRLLESPKPRLKSMQRKLLDELLAYVPPHEAAHGFRRAHSCVSNALPHLGQAVVIKLDLADFFLSISATRVRALFAALGYPQQVAALLAGLCTTHSLKRSVDAALPPPAADEVATRWLLAQRYRAPHLPQGAPTSPALANLCCFKLDLRLQAAAQAAGAVYTRYADDLSFSGGAELARGANRFIALVNEIVMDEGLRLNFRKTRVLRRGVRQQVTGLVVNQQLNTRRDDYERLKATLHNCLRDGPRSQQRNYVGDFRAHLAGRIAHVAQINPARGAKLAASFARIDWSC